MRVVAAFPAASLLALLLVLAGCGGDDQLIEGPTDAPSGERAEEHDPYEVYLENNPKPDLILSREDAQTRAYAGCGMKFAPGTVDQVLRDAYKPDCPRDDLS